MNRTKSSNNNIFWLWILLMLISSVSSITFAEVNKEMIPKNASPRTYGNGWECNLGYQEKGKNCDAIQVPENAYLTNSSYGDGWKCSWGYSKSNDNCVAIKVPANAYLEYNGNRWQCDRGFKVDNETCVPVKIPEHGFFVNSPYGKGWECERGYEAIKNTCVKLNVPVNAHIDYSGHSWDCNPPYTKQLGKCELKPKSSY